MMHHYPDLAGSTKTQNPESGNRVTEIECWNGICENKKEQRAKKVVSDSPGLEDFDIGLVNSVFNLPDGQLMFYEEFE